MECAVNTNEFMGHSELVRLVLEASYEGASNAMYQLKSSSWQEMVALVGLRHSLLMCRPAVTL